LAHRFVAKALAACAQAGFHEFVGCQPGTAEQIVQNDAYAMFMQSFCVGVCSKARSGTALKAFVPT
jgi:hypothetical protein